MSPKPIKSLLLTIVLFGFASFTHSQTTITLGDVTTSLDGTLYVDDASTGGGDNTYQDSPGRYSIGIRSFDYGLGQAGTITLSGFGFATSAATAANDAVSIDLEFFYLGADGVADTVSDPDPDDVLIGVVSDIGYNFLGAGEYFVNFGANSISGAIDGVNDQFRIWLTVNDTDGGLQESIRLKTQTGIGNKISVSGSFTAVPEPSTAMLAAGSIALGLVIVRRLRRNG